MNKPGALSRVLGVVAVLLLVVLTYRLLRAPGDPLVVYCAHDSVYADAVLRAFTERTGIPVRVKYDIEATKSLGLVELLKREVQAPRCDVFWNNELLGTMSLADDGLLEPYKGPGWERMPAAFKDPEGRWAGFGARLRVYIVNTQVLQPSEEAVAAALAGDLSSVAVAKPLYGTTLTHYTVLWHAWGGERLKAWHADWRKRGVVEALGNAHVKDLVAAGTCALGLTDSDDYFVALDDGRSVAALPVRLEGGGAICIPNTVAVIRGTRRMDAARRLVDYLLSEESERQLARSRSRQIPLGPVEGAALPGEVRQLKDWAAGAVPLADMGRARAECLAWLKAEYVQ